MFRYSQTSLSTCSDHKKTKKQKLNKLNILMCGYKHFLHVELTLKSTLKRARRKEYAHTHTQMLGYFKHENREKLIDHCMKGLSFFFLSFSFPPIPLAFFSDSCSAGRTDFIHIHSSQETAAWHTL